MEAIASRNVCRAIGASAVLAAGLVGSWTVVLAAPGNAMPVAQQNGLVSKYCAVCHSDAARNGGLSLEHFDAGDVDPSLAAMLVSKLKNGAIGAAGVPAPDGATTGALLEALSSEAAGAHKWTFRRTAGVDSASILRDLPSTRNAGAPSLYRLVITCKAATGEGEMQLSWSPAPKAGMLTAVWDERESRTYQVEGVETMGNGSGGVTGPAAFTLRDRPKMPVETLAISNLFPGETVVFPFRALPEEARRGLSRCFAEGGSEQ